MKSGGAKPRPVFACFDRVLTDFRDFLARSLQYAMIFSTMAMQSLWTLGFRQGCISLKVWPQGSGSSPSKPPHTPTSQPPRAPVLNLKMQQRISL